MKEVFRQNIESELLNYAELLNFMKETDLLILENIIKEKSEYKFNKEIYDYYYDQLTKHNFEAKHINKEILTSFAGEKYINDKYYMILDFKERELIIYEN